MTAKDPLWTQAEIADQVGLSPRKVRDYLDKLKDLLRPLGQKEPGQPWRFGQAGLAAFQRIQELREDGLQLPQIRAVLEQELAVTTPQASPGNPVAAAMAASATVSSPEPVAFLNHLQSELQQSREREAGLLAQLATANQALLEKEEAFRQEQKALVDKLEAKTEMVYQLGSTLHRLTGGMGLEPYQQHVQALEQQRHDVLAQLTRLNGKWWKRKARRQLLEQLKTLS